MPIDGGPSNSGNDIQRAAATRDLVRALESVTVDASSPNQEAFFKALIASHLVVAINPEGARRSQSVGLGQLVAMLTIPEPRGVETLALFTSMKELRKWMSDARGQALPSQQIFRNALDGGIDQVVINPNADTQAVLGGAAIRSLAAGHIPVLSASAGARNVDTEVVPHDQRVQLAPLPRPLSKSAKELLLAAKIALPHVDDVYVYAMRSVSERGEFGDEEVVVAVRSSPDASKVGPEMSTQFADLVGEWLDFPNELMAAVFMELDPRLVDFANNYAERV